MPSTGEFSLLLAKAPEQFGKLQPELAVALLPSSLPRFMDKPPCIAPTRFAGRTFAFEPHFSSLEELSNRLPLSALPSCQSRGIDSEQSCKSLLRESSRPPTVQQVACHTIAIDER